MTTDVLWSAPSALRRMVEMSQDPRVVEAGSSGALELGFSPTADLYFLLRHVAAITDPAAADVWADDLVAARTAFDIVKHVPPYAIDPYCAGWTGTDDALAAAASDLPDDIAGIPARRFVTAIAELMLSVRPKYNENALERRQARVAEATGIVQQLLGDKVGDCLGFIARAFDLEAIREPVRVRLTASGVPFGGLTGDGPDERPLCFVSVQDNSGPLLVEMVLHEAVHALTLQAANAEDVPIARLREEIGRRGMLADFDLGQLWHVPYFVTAAAAVKRHVDQAHVAYGSASGYYERVPQSAGIAIPTWTEVLEGRLTGAQAVTRILSALDG